MAEIDLLFTPVSVPIRDDTHAVVASQRAHRMAVQLGFSPVEQTSLSTAILEIARNIVKYAGRGEMVLVALQDEGRVGIAVLACDDGPGIADVDLALKDGFTTGRGLGLGLPGARRLMDDFDIASALGRGTTVIMEKWKRT